MIRIVRPHILLNESSGTRKLPSLQGHFHRFGQHTLLLIPHTCSAIPRMQGLFSKTLPGLLLHGLGEEWVIAIPLPGAIERLQKQISILHRFEELLTIVSPGDGITERTGQTTEHACLEKKDLERLWLCIQHFCDEELQNMPVAAGESRKKVLDLLLGQTSLEHEGDQAQSGHPAFQAGIKVADFLRGERSRQGLPEKNGRLLL